MAQRMVNIIVSSDLSPTKPDFLSSDCLRIEATPKLQLAPHQDTKINLMIHNTSLVGRMGKVVANYDPREVKVKIPTSEVYVAPEGRTIVHAIIIPLIKDSQTKVVFDIL